MSDRVPKCPATPAPANAKIIGILVAIKNNPKITPTNALQTNSIQNDDHLNFLPVFNVVK